MFEASGSPPGEEPELGLEATGIDVGEHRDGPGLELPCLILPPGPMVDVGEMAPQGGLPMTMTGSDRDLDRRLENGDGTIELAPVGEDQGLAVEGGHQEHLVVAGETGRVLGVLEGLCRTWFVLLGLLVFWFPDGKPASQRWGLLVWLGVPIGLLAASYVVAGEICLSANDDGECLEWAVNPIGISWLPNPEFGPLSTVGYMFLALFVILSTASLVSRYVNAHHLQRQQIKWFAFAVCTLIVVTIVQETMAGLTPLPGVVLDVLWGATVLGLPVAIGVAVLRYRLYDIDRIVSRTVTYLLVVGLLGLVFVGLVTVIGSMAPSDSDLAIAASTLAVAALFNPLRRRVQAAIERRFNRARYDAWKVTDAFARSLRNRVDPDDVAAGWRDAVTETMQPESAGVWIRS